MRRGHGPELLLVVVVVLPFASVGVELLVQSGLVDLARGRRAAAVARDVVPDRLADGLAALRRDAPRDAHGRDAPRLRHEHARLPFVFRPRRINNILGHLRRLAAAGLARDDDGPVRRDQFHNLRLELRHRQGLAPVRGRLVARPRPRGAAAAPAAAPAALALAASSVAAFAFAVGSPAAAPGHCFALRLASTVRLWRLFSVLLSRCLLVLQAAGVGRMTAIQTL